ncbi:hypothetical protein B0H19DRAFT_1057195 [Mycena capillaripes]|nr:hypothetical protein B0H19DRAFT_1057195 [Mycena capillaripes]
MPWTLCGFFQFPHRFSVRRRRTNPVTKEQDASEPESDLLDNAESTEQNLHEDTYNLQTSHTGRNVLKFALSTLGSVSSNIPFSSVLSSVIDPLLDIVNRCERGSTTLLNTKPNRILLETKLSVLRANFRTLRPVWGVCGMIETLRELERPQNVQGMAATNGSTEAKRGKTVCKEKRGGNWKRPQNVQGMAATNGSTEAKRGKTVHKGKRGGNWKRPQSIQGMASTNGSAEAERGKIVL